MDKRKAGKERFTPVTYNSSVCLRVFVYTFLPGREWPFVKAFNLVVANETGLQIYTVRVL